MTASHLHIHKKCSGKVDICMVNLVGTAFLYFHPEHLSHEWVEDFRHNGFPTQRHDASKPWGPWELTSLRDQIHGSADQFRFSFLPRQDFFAKEDGAGKNESSLRHMFFWGGCSVGGYYTKMQKKHLPISLDAHKCKWSCPLWGKNAISSW